MKKVLAFALILTLALPISAQQALLGKSSKMAQMDKSPYMEGAVPEVNGKVVFSKSIAAPGMSKADIFKILASWANLRFMANTEYGLWNEPSYFKNLEYSAVKIADPVAGRLVCFGNEEQVFSNKVLAKDYTVLNYNLSLDITDGNVNVTMTDIAYTYTLSNDPERILAEDWITDKEAISKRGKLLRISGKFRIKTIDVKNEIFEEIENNLKKN